MRQLGSRTIIVNKKQLISKIEANKKAHVKGYKKAVTAYKREALKQIKEITKDVRGGGLSVGLSLTTPINNEANYDKIIDMFNWELSDQVTLVQSEFNEYVQDETQFAINAYMSNTMYTG